MSGMGGRSASELAAPGRRLLTSRPSDLMASLTRSAARSPRDVSAGPALRAGGRGAAEKSSRLDPHPVEIRMSNANGATNRNVEGIPLKRVAIHVPSHVVRRT